MPDKLSEKIARQIANLVVGGATLQLGIGTIPDAVERELDPGPGHRAKATADSCATSYPRQPLRSFGGLRGDCRLGSPHLSEWCATPVQGVN